MRMMRRKPHSRPYKKGKVTTILTNTESKKQGYKSKAKSQYFHKRVGLSSDVTLSVTTSGISGGVSTTISGMYDHSNAKYSDITY